MIGTRLRMTSAYHPQADGQTEILNRYLEQHLRALTDEHPKYWYSFLGWVEYNYNASHHSAIGMSPFEALYGCPPPSIPTYIRGSSPIQALEDTLITRDEVLQRLKQNLLQAQNKMQQMANKRRRDLHFQIGDLLLVFHRQSTEAKRFNSKLC